MGTIDENGLKPCPFCGGEAKIEKLYAGGRKAVCTQCKINQPVNCKTDVRGDEGDIYATEQWNTRVSDSPKQPDSSGENEGLKEFREMIRRGFGYVADSGGRRWILSDEEHRILMDGINVLLSMQSYPAVTAERLLAGIDVDEVANEVERAAKAQIDAFDDELRGAYLYNPYHVAEAAIASIKRQIDKQGVK